MLHGKRQYHVFINFKTLGFKGSAHFPVLHFSDIPLIKQYQTIVRLIRLTIFQSDTLFQQTSFSCKYRFSSRTDNSISSRDAECLTTKLFEKPKTFYKIVKKMNVLLLSSLDESSSCCY